MKYAVVLIAVFLSRAALAQDLTCGARTPHELRTVFTVAVGLNDAVRRAATEIAPPQYRALRAKFERYEERQALPCAAAAAALLADTPDAELARALLELASTHAGSTSDLLPRLLARFLSSQPAAFSQALRGLPRADRCAVVKTAESGRMGREPAADAVRTAQRNGFVAYLERQHCHVSGSKPAKESQRELPRNGARERLVLERRQWRPRFARATPVAASVLASASPSQPRRAGAGTFNHPGLPGLSTKRSSNEIDERS